MMDRDAILATLRDHAPELQAAGLAHLRLFGSASRDEASSSSDIDLLVDFAVNKPVTLITLGGFEQRLGALLGAEVELCSAEWLKPHIRERALSEAIHVFYFFDRTVRM
jgi:predicted nucleotidyltransferase